MLTELPGTFVRLNARHSSPIRLFPNPSEFESFDFQSMPLPSLSLFLDGEVDWRVDGVTESRSYTLRNSTAAECFQIRFIL